MTDPHTPDDKPEDREAITTPPHESTYPGLPHSEEQDWQDVEPCFSRLIESARPYLGAIRALVAETSNRREKQRYQSLVRDLDGTRTIEEIFDRGKDIHPAKVETLQWKERGNSRYGHNDIIRTAGKGVGKTITYPIILTMGLMVFSLIFCLTIVPNFRDIFIEFALPLSPPTEFLLGITPYLVVGILVCLGALMLWFFRRLIWSPSLRQRIAFRVPLVRRVYRNAAYGEFCHLLSFLLHSDAPFAAAVRVAARATLPRSAANRLANLTVPTHSLTTQSCPQRLTVVLRAPLPPDQKAGLLRELAVDFYQRATRRSAALIEPIIITAFGVFVGFAVISLFMPLISLVTNLSG